MITYPKVQIKTGRISDIIEVDKSKLIKFPFRSVKIYLGPYPSGVIEPRSDGSFAGHALFLPEGYEYVIGRDEVEQLVLLVFRKED